MTSRFSEGLRKLKEGSDARAPTATEPNRPSHPALPETSSPGTLRYEQPNRRGKVIISAYFDPAVRKQLAILAVEQDTSQAALIAEALNLLFEKHRRPPIAKA
jgi:hypothetical protein